MTRDTIVNLADVWSERKGKQFDLEKMYQLQCQHICKQNRFWWRQQYCTFNLVVGTKTYDLTSISTTPSFTEIGFEEIITWALINPTAQAIPSAGGTPTAKLIPIFDEEAIFAMIENTTNAQPGRYTVGVDGLQVLRIDPPDQAYKTRLSFWGIPNFNDDTSSQTVPLIPPWHHGVIAQGMAAEILEMAYGEQDIKAATMRAKYNAGLTDMQMRPRFTTDYVASLATQEEAVRST